jgi:dihydrofolate synthase/folylpolyglutamate synthase
VADPGAVLKNLAERRPALIDLGLDRMRAALMRLGDPQLRMPPVFHVAGTNGKGSTVAYLRSILEAQGKTVHIYTSPHLVRFNERIVVAGEEIGDERLIEVLSRCDNEVGSKALTFFEATTCAAFLAFAETPADYLVLEVGLGGRLDATNVLVNPLAAIVAPVALDHQHFLGGDLASIANEKAGIFRQNTPAVIGVQPPEAMQALESRAKEAGARLFAYGSFWNAYSEHGRLIYQDENGLCDLDPPRLTGAHQIMNAGLAVAALRAAGLKVPDNIISKGLVGAKWPARLQLLRRGPIMDLARARYGAGAEVWLDGGHNPHAARAVAAAIADIEERSPKSLALIVGMQDNKDWAGFLAAFSSLASAAFTVQARHEGAASAEEIAEAAERAGIPARPCASVLEAVRYATDGQREPVRILICGSLYLAGEILRDNS